MESSDSDTENECFESAEESVDEDDRNDVKSKSETSLTEGGSKFTEPVGSHCDTVSPVQQVNEDVTANTTSYRKRPERVKRMPSKPSSKIASKSTDELIFKADKIVSDVFLQEVTSNLSRNINKSLSTLQQTSSNVKDLILNSLPVSSPDDNHRFSYDDKNSNYAPANTFQEKKPFQYTENAGDSVNKKDKNNVMKPSTKEFSCPVVDEKGDDIKKEEPSSITTSNLENSDKNLKEKLHDTEDVSIESSKIKEQILDNPDICLEPPLISNSNLSNAAEITQGPKESAINKEIEILEPNKETTVCQEKNLSKTTTNLQNESSSFLPHESAYLQCHINKQESEEKNNLIKNDFDSQINKSSNNVCDNYIGSSEPAVSSGALILEPAKDVTDTLEKKPERNTECNVKELKNALKNLIIDDKSNTENIEDNSNKNIANEEVKVEGKPSENESNEGSKEGWDDFDFSDIEEDNLAPKGDNIQKAGLKEQGQKSSSKSTNPKTETSKSKSENPVKKNSSNEKEAFVESNKEIVEIKSTAEDAWDWDAWEEENKETSEVKATESLKHETPAKASSDLSTWSGWDNFGQKSEEKGVNWRLGSWGVDLLLNKATAVTQGISNVLEAGLGAPDPETLARMEKMERQSSKESRKDEIESEEQYSGEVSKKNSLTNVNLFPVSGITSLVAGVTSKIVEHSKIQEIGSKVITGGLDTLETFGKKTMEVLQDGDPGLKNKRAFLLGDQKPVLSQVLREAREKAEREHKKVEERELARKCHFETLFDDFQGMVHLEALEMLSRQYELKLEQLRTNSENPEEFDETLKEVEELCSLYENDTFLKNSSKLEFKIKLQMAIKPLVNEIPIQRIIQIQEGVSNWLRIASESKPPVNTVNQKLVSTLAELSAAAVQVFHKSGELLSVKECRETVEEVDTLLRLTDVLCTEISGLNEKFILLFKNGISNEISEEKVTNLSENATTVMTNSISYIRQAFNLLIPVIQFGAAVY